MRINKDLMLVSHQQNSDQFFFTFQFKRKYKVKASFIMGSAIPFDIDADIPEMEELDFEELVVEESSSIADLMNELNELDFAF